MILGDPRALLSILTMIKNTGRQARRRLSLSEFEFDILQGVGINHQAADILSRLNT